MAHWNLQPSEFWNMTPQEWWHIYEAKHGIKTRKYGSLNYDEYTELADIVKDIKKGKYG